MNLRSVEEIRPNVRVILRMDLDVPQGDNSRLLKSVPTIRYLLEQNCKIAIIGHKGRPIGREEKYSLRSVYVELMGILGEMDSIFLENFDEIPDNQVLFFENLRYWEGEEKNDNTFMQNLTGKYEAFVNDAFAVAHRRHASVMLCNIMDTYLGFSFVEETEKISKILENPERPLIVVLGGAKEDKLSYLPELVKVADKILVGGKLPKLISYQNDKIIVGKLREDTMDLSQETIADFVEIINSSKTIIWAGAMGCYEDKNCRIGTQAIAEAIALNTGFKIIAGGDTAASIESLGYKSRVDYVCSGGGVMLEFITKGTLPALE